MKSVMRVLLLLSLSLCLVVPLSAAGVIREIPIVASIHSPQTVGMLDSVLPRESYRAESDAPLDPADGMPEYEYDGRFGEDPETPDNAAGGEQPAPRQTPEVPFAADGQGLSPWVAVLILSMITTAVVIAVLYLVPSRKNKDK